MRNATLNAFAVIALLLCPCMSPAASLPQQHPWQVTLRQHLATLKPSDFTVARTAWDATADFSKHDDERLYRDWIALGPSAGRLPPNAGLHTEPEAFTLAGIEREDGVFWVPHPAAMAWWAQFDVPGNPFSGSEPAKRRALVSAIVDMMMLETAWADPLNIKPDFMGANLGTWAYVYLHGRTLLPKDVQAAYEQGMRHYLDAMLRIAPRDGNTNMDMRCIATLATLAEVFHDDAAMRQRLVDGAKRILFGAVHRGPATSDPRRGTYHPAGYIGEADGPETSYNGISIFHLLEAAMITRGDPAWDAFMPEVVGRMLRFKAYNTFPEPDGRWEGPSSWSTRTNDPYVRDQRDRPWRPMASAMLSEEGLFLLRASDASISRETMLQQIRQGMNRFRGGPIRAEGPGKGIEPVLWAEEHWPPDIPYTWDEYVPGSYAALAKHVAGKSPMLQAPYSRAADFSISFDDEFWSARHGDWGFQVEAVPHMSRSYDTGGSGSLSGGSLAAFWTRGAGLVVLGRLPDKWNYVTWTPKDGVPAESRWSVDRWTTHHLWGRTAEGKAFSSARQRHPAVSFELGGDVPTVRVMGMLGGAGTVEEDHATIRDVDHVAYRRTFEKTPQGLRITSELISRGEDAKAHRGQAEDRRDTVTELWESIPIYIDRVPREERARVVTPGTTIELKTGGQWKKAGTGATDDVQAIRVTRHGQPVLIEFDGPQRVDLGEGPVRTSYQSHDIIQNVRVDLLRAGGKAVTMPKRSGVTYLIKPG